MSHEGTGSSIESRGAAVGGEAEPLRPRRLSIVGATGSGKSVLARRLAEAWHLPLYELDTIYWQKGGLSPQEFTAAVAEVTAREEWVLDGHYRAVRTTIWRRADMVVWLNYPLWLVGYRLLRRYMNKQSDHSGRAKDSGDRPVESPDHHRASWRNRLGRFARTIHERREYRHLLGSPEFRDVAVVEFRSPAAMERWLRQKQRQRAPSL